MNCEILDSPAGEPGEPEPEQEPDRSAYTCTDCGRKASEFKPGKVLAFCDDNRKQFYCGCRGWN